MDQFDLVDVIRDGLDLLQPSIDGREATVVFQAPAGPLQLVANRLRIEQVVTNIVRNALDAVEDTEAKQVTITAGSADGQVWFKVADTGHGLGDKTLDDLREPFATTKESGQGMGLGLTISAGIVSDHGGTIAATEQATGGAVFHICLPCNMQKQS